MGFAAAAPYVIPAAATIGSGLLSKKANKPKQTQARYMPINIVDPNDPKKTTTFYRLIDAGGQSYQQPNAWSIAGNALAGAGQMYGVNELGKMQDASNFQRQLTLINTMYPPQQPGPWLGNYGGQGNP